MPGSATWISFHGHWELWKSFAEGKWDLSTIFQDTEFIITMILIAKGEGNTNNKSIHHMSKVKGCHSHDYVALFMTLYQRVGGRDPPASLDEADCLLVKVPCSRELWWLPGPVLALSRSAIKSRAPQSFIHKERNSANNLNEPGNSLLHVTIRVRTQPSWHPHCIPWDPDQS